MVRQRVSAARVKLIGFDIDGVFTDGRFYLADNGVESKAFFTQDGFGIRRILDAGFEIAVISGRQSKAVDRRMAELGVKHVFQGCRDKVHAFEALAEELGIDMLETAFVGDDSPDLPLLQRVGFPIAVANAVEEVKAGCSYTTAARGGAGAVREVCELILAGQQKSGTTE